MPAPAPHLAGALAVLLERGAGFFFAQSQSAWVTIFQGLVGAGAGGGMIALVRLWTDYKTNKASIDQRIAAMQAQHDKELAEAEAQIAQAKGVADAQIEKLKLEIEQGTAERMRIEESAAIKYDVAVIRIQDLQLGEAWLKEQLQVATGKKVPPKPPLFTPEADKLLGSSGMYQAVGMPGKDILVVDDSASTIQRLKRFLRHYGWAVRGASGVAQALHMIEERKPDIILTDLMMPGRNGTELVREVRGGGDLNTRIVVLTAYMDTGLVAEVRELGADAVLEKPYDPDRLLELITPIEEVPDSSEGGV